MGAANELGGGSFLKIKCTATKALATRCHKVGSHMRREVDVLCKTAPNHGFLGH
jgi:hypothetical protein